MEQQREIYQTEYEIADLIRMRLYQRSHGLAVVLGALETQIGDLKGKYWTDGRRLYLDAGRLRRDFLEKSERPGTEAMVESEWLCLEFLHMISHCLLGHPFSINWRDMQQPQGQNLRVQGMLDLEAWELAEKLWGEKIPLLEQIRENADIFQEENGKVLAEQLYVDSHEEWIQRPQKELAKWWGQQGAELRKNGIQRKRKSGTAKRSRSQHLVPASGHRGDYREILQGLSSFREDSRINPEEFQYAWYEYGLEHYGNMPLIEPLEYREERKIEDLVLVIDTSGSCEKDLVRIFLEETKGILEQEQLFFRRFCLHILQCDNRVQRDDKITSQEEFEDYLDNLTITGGGGTDFEPAFRHIKKLKKAGEFRDLRGVLYFTDGCGLYPREEPDYEVYFVMLKNHYDAIDMPGWIHPLVLEERSER